MNRPMPQSVSMILMNQGHPFVSKALAERLCLAILDDRYPDYIFRPKSQAEVSDGDDIWLVTFENELVPPDENSQLPMVNGKLVPRNLTFVIRKSNAEVIDIR